MIRKIIIFTSFLLFVLGTVAAQTINKVEPLFWWAGMRNPELQLMVYGDHISEYHPVINEPGVYLKSCVTVDSPNYLILYLDLSQAHSGTFDITFVNGEKKFVYAYELKERKESFGVIFMDPPYNQELEKRVLSCLKDSKVADERTLIIIEASLETDFSYLKEFGFRVLKRKEYKTNVHMFIEKEKKEL